jgi:hypothetical protein
MMLAETPLNAGGQMIDLTGSIFPIIPVRVDANLSAYLPRLGERHDIPR